MRRHAGRSAAPEVVHDALRAPGRPLDQPVRAHFESRFHQDFSRVRVHAGSDAARSADAINARAYTAGSDIVIGAREYDPTTRNGHRLLAHEMGHVVQQGHAPIDARLTIEKDPANLEPLHRESATVMRADRDAVRQVRKLENVAGAGIHFFPDTLVRRRSRLPAAVRSSSPVCSPKNNSHRRSSSGTRPTSACRA